MLQGRIKQLLLATLLCAPILSIAAELSVLLPNQGVRLDYPQSVRLETILRDVQKQAQAKQVRLEPIQAQLFDSKKQVIVDEMKQQVLSQLSDLAQIKPELDTQSISEQINASKFHYREFTSLDYDVVQSQRKGNPLLTGSYQLNIAPRINNIYFLGAVKKAEEVKLHAQWFLADYFDMLGNIKSEAAYDGTATIIQPDGKVMEAQYGAWNFKPHFIAPGAIIYIPIKSLPSELETLNQDIVQLLRHKVINNEQ
ncbi:capsule biosynthesis GfcC family protein [Vibrio sp. ER1A]|uniref:capsule biosynthesis GfcC family protein n=1 Tax=Vibrio sp. ER1A TaxID=1517681 RepID=UPI0004DCCA28|nr:capsule biosynthesis GfcC family protein [Vibrio sp. ER1A]KFA95187.1 hypothetical protein HW45_27270 [Vibrio sp. ER1A]